MATVPYSPVPGISPQTSVPDDYERIPSDPGQFGGLIAQGTQQLGAGALKANQFHSEVAADDATNQYMEGARKILQGDPNDVVRDESGKPILDEKGQPQPDRGFLGLQGAAAMHAQAGVEARLEALRSQLHDNLQTPEQQLQFDQYTRRMRYQQNLQIGSHAEQQSNVWAAHVEAASGTNAKAEIASAALNGDQDEVARHSNDLVGRYVREATRLGARPGDDVFNAAKLRGQQEAIETQVNALLPGNPAAAQKLFNDNVPLLSGLPGFDSLNNRVTNYADRHIGQQAGRDAFFGAGAGAASGGAAGIVTPGDVATSARNQGVDPTLANATAALESGHGANVGSGEHAAVRGNIFQMGPGERQMTGGSAASMGTTAEQVNQGVRYLALNKAALTDSLGRTPTNAEVYLAHQQGATGAGRLISNPDRRAGDIVGDAAIRDNGGDPNAPSSQFVSMWRQKYAQAESGFKQYAQAGPDTVAATPATGPTAQLASAAPQAPRAPTREEIIGRLPEGLSENAYNHAYAEANRLYTHWEQATSSDRAQLKQSIRTGIPMLEDGRDFDYDPNRIRSLLPPDQADQAIDLLEDAKTVGQQKMAVRGMSMPEALTQSAANQAQLAKAPPGEFVKMKKMSDAFDKAADQHFKALFADPAGYLTATNPEIERLRQAVTTEQPDQAAASRAAGQPTAFEKYASALTEEQDRLGVPPESQHILGVQGAPKVVQDITANPSQAPTKIRQMEEGYGTAWPAVWRDLATVGKMPTGYQALGVLQEADAEQLARGLGAGKEGKAWDTLIGATTKNELSKEVRGDGDVQKLLTSLRTEGASPTQVADFLGTINTLAFTKQMEGDTAPSANAAKAFTSLYSFMPNGGARVPAKQFDATSSNAALTLQGLHADNLTIPPGFSSGRPGMPTPQDYVSLIQATPSWVNTQGDSLVLMSGSPLSRIVRDRAGNPISVKFSTPAPPQTALTTPPAIGLGP